MDQYRQYIAASRYARFIDDKGRRETWDETVSRFVDYVFSRTTKITDNKDLKESIYNAVLLVLKTGP
jgi:ribonucleoside-diphosphate reductase alpha chain